MKHYIVKVSLYGITPEIWRRFSVPADFTFARFHSTIQSAMGWEHKYDHEFRHGKGKYLRDVIAQENPERFAKADSFQDENLVTLAGFIGRSPLPKRFLYLYDFADEWIHEVTVEKTADIEHDGPQMIDGARACPPEACGGTLEYLELCAGMCDWHDGTWDAENFDISAISFAIKKAVGKKKR